MKQETKICLVIRYLLTIFILVQIALHAHWSVALFAILVSIEIEIRNLKKL